MPRKESETFDEPSFLNDNDDLDRLNLDPKIRSFATTEKRQNDSSIDPSSLNINTINTPINQTRILEFEKKAKMEKHGFFGVYHVSTTQSDTVFDSFENFLQRMIEDEEYARRTFSVASDFFDQYTIKKLRTESFNS